jgi:hypothetical protein
MDARGIERASCSCSLLNDIQDSCHEALHDCALSRRLHTTKDKGHEGSWLFKFLLVNSVDFGDVLEQLILVI